MVKRLLLILAATAGGMLAQTVTGVTFKEVTHSAARIDIAWTGTVTQLRLRYIAAPGTCIGGTGGTVTGRVTVASSEDIGGLKASTVYNLCPEVSSNGTTWSTGFSTSFTTLAAPATHPALPIAPATFDTSYPDTTGFTTLTLSPDCSDWDAKVNNTAIPDQRNHGYIITVPHAAVCKGLFNITARAADMATFLPSQVDATANTITLSSHGLNEGDRIVFGTQYACLPGADDSVGSNKCYKTGQVQDGRPMYVHKIDANTIQIYSAGVGSPIVAFNGHPGTGTAAYNSMFWAKYPRVLNPIIIQNDLVGTGGFVPEHVRVAPEWSSQMPKMIFPGSQAYTYDVNPVHMCCTGRLDGGERIMAANIRFVGIEMTSESDGSGDTSSDPLALAGLISIDTFSDHIILDRCYIHGPGSPYRVWKPISWNGLNTAFVDNYMDKMVFFHVVSTLGLSSSTSSRFTINAGKIQYSVGKSGTVKTPVTVNLTGSGSGTGYVYYDWQGNLNVSGPPGVTPSCTGGTCAAYASDPIGGGVSAPGTSPVFPTTASSNAYAVSPVFSTVPTGTNPNVVWNDPSVFTPVAYGSFELGTRFVSKVSGYVVGVQFYKQAGDTGTSHTVSLWSSSGGLLGRTVTLSEAAGPGWITGTLTTPVAVSANTTYVASYNTGSVGAYVQANQFLMNRQYTNGNLTALAAYAAENGWGNSNDNWPKNNFGRTQAGIIGLFRVSGGAITSLYNADYFSTLNSLARTEGCQCMIGGIGPGPWMAINNQIEGAGNLWHHDDQLWWDRVPGVALQPRGDATYTRNTFHLAPYAWWGGPQSDGLAYYHRQDFETKGMNRIKFTGNIFDTAINDVAANGLTIGSYNLAGGMTDFDYQYNEFRHIPGIFDYSANGGDWEFPKRFRFKNNLMWDFDTKYQSLNPAMVTVPPNNWLLNGGNGMEDFIIDHNTFVGNQGRAPVIMGFMGPDHSEGFQVTNNIFYVDSQYQAVMGDFSTENGQSTCTGGGWNLWSCKVANGVWSHNVMMPSQYSASNPLWNGSIFSNATQASLQAVWGNDKTNDVNYFPASPNMTDVGWFYVNPDKSQGGDFHLKDNYCSGCGQPATDGKDVGADIDGLHDAQGVVTIIGASVGTTTATVTFVAPDSQSCPVDYSNTDSTLITKFSRATDSGTGRVRNVFLSGLNGGTVYHFRVNCAVQQPKSKFRTSGNLAGSAPVINSFSASPTTVVSGASSTLSWSVTGATSLSIDPIGTVTGTSTSVSPTATTTYTLRATNSVDTTTSTATITVTSSDTTAPSQAGSFTSLVFNDEFNTLDLAANGSQTNHKWYPGVFFACAPPVANTTVSAGVLDLQWTYGQASCYDTPVDTTIMSHNQTSTMTAAAGQAFKYGYYEVRAKQDVGPYTWSAFWLNGEYGTGGTFAELDVFEFVNIPSDGGYHLYGTLHTWPNDSPKDGGNLLPTPAGTDFTQYHTYGFLWTSTTLKWYFDGQLMRTATPPASANSGPPLYLLLSQQVGQNWSTGAPSGTRPYNHLIDYVRVWQ